MPSFCHIDATLAHGLLSQLKLKIVTATCCFVICLVETLRVLSEFGIHWSTVLRLTALSQFFWETKGNPVTCFIWMDISTLIKLPCHTLWRGKCMGCYFVHRSSTLHWSLECKTLKSFSIGMIPQNIMNITADDLVPCKTSSGHMSMAWHWQINVLIRVCFIV